MSYNMVRNFVDEVAHSHYLIETSHKPVTVTLRHDSQPAVKQETPHTGHTQLHKKNQELLD